MIKENPEILLNKLKKVNYFVNKLNELKIYITHLETMPLSQEYENCMNEFYKLTCGTN